MEYKYLHSTFILSAGGSFPVWEVIVRVTFYLLAYFELS